MQLVFLVLFLLQLQASDIQFYFHFTSKNKFCLVKFSAAQLLIKNKQKKQNNFHYQAKT